MTVADFLIVLNKELRGNSFRSVFCRCWEGELSPQSAAVLSSGCLRQFSTSGESTSSFSSMSNEGFSLLLSMMILHHCNSHVSYPFTH